MVNKETINKEKNLKTQAAPATPVKPLEKETQKKY